MSKNGTETTVTSIPQCDIHAHVMHTAGVPALYDARTLSGSWGYVCEECFQTFTSTKLGTGYGQRLILKGEVAEPETVWCTDPRHDEPCRADCLACIDECGQDVAQ